MVSWDTLSQVLGIADALWLSHLKPTQPVLHYVCKDLTDLIRLVTKFRVRIDRVTHPIRGDRKTQSTSGSNGWKDVCFSIDYSFRSILTEISYKVC